MQSCFDSFAPTNTGNETFQLSSPKTKIDCIEIAAEGVVVGSVTEHNKLSDVADIDYKITPFPSHQRLRRQLYSLRDPARYTVCAVACKSLLSLYTFFCFE